MTGLRVAVSHVADDHGVSRYGDRLMGFLSRAGVVNAHHVPAQTSSRSLARELRVWLRHDVVHVQWSPLYWGEGAHVLARALLLALVGRRVPVVVTMHDVHHERWQAPATPSARVAAADAPQSSRSRAPRRARALRRRLRLVSRPSHLAQLVVLRSAADVLVFSSEEAGVLARRRTTPPTVVPHFVEDWVGPRAPAEPPRLVVFGFIHPRKGQLLAVEALVSVPGVSLVLCGAAEPRHQDYLDRVLQRAHDLGVSDRVQVTGHVDDRDLAEVLSTSRLALCPYQRIAASGSMSTLVAHGVPIVAHATAYSTRLAVAAPRAISVFSPWTAEALAEGVRAALATPVDDDVVSQLHALADRDGPAATAARHQDLYARAAREGRGA